MIEEITMRTDASGEIIETTTTTKSEPRPSVEIRQTAQGKAQITVKAYGKTAADAAQSAMEVYAALSADLASR